MKVVHIRRVKIRMFSELKEDLKVAMQKYSINPKRT
jgi:hypothetical protein